MAWAVVTGASSGIGREIARLHAREGGDLVIVARRGHELQLLADELRDRHGCSVEVVVADLSSETGIAELLSACGDREIDILVNNAGFGGLGAFDQQPLERSAQMIDLNIRSLTTLTHHFLAPMRRRGHGRILNVGSTAGFVPGPLQAVYYASKAYVNSFSQALHHELRGSGISVTVLAPGPVATEFMQVASMSSLSVVRHAPSADKVAELGYRAMLRGDLLVVDDWRLAVVGRIAGLVPRHWILALSRRMLEKKVR